MAGTPGGNFIPSGEIVEIKSGENSSEGGYSPWIMHPGSPPSEGYPGQGPFSSLADMYSNLDIEPWTPGHQGIDAYFPTYESFRLAVIDSYEDEATGLAAMNEAYGSPGSGDSGSPPWFELDNNRFRWFRFTAPGDGVIRFKVAEVSDINYTVFLTRSTWPFPSIYVDYSEASDYDTIAIVSEGESFLVRVVGESTQPEVANYGDPIPKYQFPLSLSCAFEEVPSDWWDQFSPDQLPDLQNAHYYEYLQNFDDPSLANANITNLELGPHPYAGATHSLASASWGPVISPSRPKSGIHSARRSLTSNFGSLNFSSVSSAQEATGMMHWQKTSWSQYIDSSKVPYWYGGNSANGFARIYVKVEGTNNSFQWALSPTWTWGGASTWPGSYGPSPHVSVRKWPNTILFQLFWGHSLIPGGFTTALAHAYDTGVPAWDRWVDASVEMDGVRNTVTIQVDNWKRTFLPEELAPGRKITQIDMNYDFVTVTSNDSLSQNTDFLDDLYMAHGRYPYPIPNVDPEIIEGAFDLTRCRFAQ